MSSPASSSSVGVVEGFLYESRVYGMGAPSYNTVTIFIPSMNLKISKDGHASRSEREVQSKKVANRAQETLANYNGEWAGDEAKDDKERVQVPVEIANKIDALVKESEALKARQKVIDDSIATLAKRLF